MTASTSMEKMNGLRVSRFDDCYTFGTLWATEGLGYYDAKPTLVTIRVRQRRAYLIGRPQPLRLVTTAVMTSGPFRHVSIIDIGRHEVLMMPTRFLESLMSRLAFDVPQQAAEPDDRPARTPSIKDRTAG